MNSKRLKITFSLLIVSILLLGILWNSSLFAEHRAFSEVVRSRRLAYEEHSYKNETLIDIYRVEGFDFYIFKADEYNEDIYSSTIYVIVKSEKIAGLFSSFEQFSFHYEGQYGSSWGTNEDGTFVVGLKEVNDFDQIILSLDDETKLVDVSDSKVLFYFTKEKLNIDSFEKKAN